jgi:hypothetical protein
LWTRRELLQWLLAELRSSRRFDVGRRLGMEIYDFHGGFEREKPGKTLGFTRKKYKKSLRDIVFLEIRIGFEWRIKDDHRNSMCKHRIQRWTSMNVENDLLSWWSFHVLTGDYVLFFG